MPVLRYQSGFDDRYHEYHEVDVEADTYEVFVRLLAREVADHPRELRWLDVREVRRLSELSSEECEALEHDLAVEVGAEEERRARGKIEAERLERASKLRADAGAQLRQLAALRAELTPEAAEARQAKIDETLARADREEVS